MENDLIDAVTDTHGETIRKALDAAFGSAPIEMIAPIGGEASGAFPFRVHIGDRQYLVRVEGAPSPLRNPHQYEAMRIASAAGIAPDLPDGHRELLSRPQPVSAPSAAL